MVARVITQKKKTIRNTDNYLKLGCASGDGNKNSNGIILIGPDGTMINVEANVADELIKTGFENFSNNGDYIAAEKLLSPEDHVNELPSDEKHFESKTLRAGRSNKSPRKAKPSRLSFLEFQKNNEKNIKELRDSKDQTIDPKLNDCDNFGIGAVYNKTSSKKYILTDNNTKVVYHDDTEREKNLQKRLNYSNLKRSHLFELNIANMSKEGSIGQSNLECTGRSKFSTNEGSSNPTKSRRLATDFEEKKNRILTGLSVCKILTSKVNDLYTILHGNNTMMQHYMYKIINEFMPDPDYIFIIFFPFDDKDFYLEKFGIKSLIMKLNNSLKFGDSGTEDKTNSQTKHILRSLRLAEMEKILDLRGDEVAWGMEQQFNKIADDLAFTEFQMNLKLLREYEIFIKQLDEFTYKHLHMEISKTEWETNYLIESCGEKYKCLHEKDHDRITSRIVKIVGPNIDFESMKDLNLMQSHEKDVIKMLGVAEARVKTEFAECSEENKRRNDLVRNTLMNFSSKVQECKVDMDPNTFMRNEKVANKWNFYDQKK